MSVEENMRELSVGLSHEFLLALGKAGLTGNPIIHITRCGHRAYFKAMLKAVQKKLGDAVADSEHKEAPAFKTDGASKIGSEDFNDFLRLFFSVGFDVNLVKQIVNYKNNLLAKEMVSAYREVARAIEPVELIKSFVFQVPENYDSDVDLAIFKQAMSSWGGSVIDVLDCHAARQRAKLEPGRGYLISVNHFPLPDIYASLPGDEILKRSLNLLNYAQARFLGIDGLCLLFQHCKQKMDDQCLSDYETSMVYTRDTQYLCLDEQHKKGEPKTIITLRPQRPKDNHSTTIAQWIPTPFRIDKDKEDSRTNKIGVLCVEDYNEF